MEPYIGQVQPFSFNFPPKDWAFCDGRLLSIVQNQALFSLIGTTYGGDGITTFALPALRGRIPIGFGREYVWYNGHYNSQPNGDWGKRRQSAT